MEEIYNKWQLTELELKNIEPVIFTKEELLDFANYYYKNKLNIGSVSNTFVCKECGNNKKAVDTTLGVHRCSKCRSAAN